MRRVELPPGILQTEPGWYGAFTREQVPEAKLANGARIKKIREERGDATAIGTQGTVLGSIKAPDLPDVGYFVEWDNRPRAAVFVVGWKIDAA